jgi:hypothetical protein
VKSCLKLFLVVPEHYLVPKNAFYRVFPSIRYKKNFRAGLRRGAPAGPARHFSIRFVYTRPEVMAGHPPLAAVGAGSPKVLL